MIDLAPHLTQLQQLTWTKEQLDQVLRTIRTYTDFWVDWDTGAGESWASVGNSTPERIAIISALIPLAIGVGDPKFWEPLMQPGEYIVIPDFDTPIFYCNEEILTRVLEWPENYEIIDAACFSAEDLWYATI